jgi:hypothetical protein
MKTPDLHSPVNPGNTDLVIEDRHNDQGRQRKPYVRPRLERHDDVVSKTGFEFPPLS